MVIGLYDIDLWHRGKAMPNLELMKMYNYHHKNNDTVIMMKPNENEGRFNRIIYFKDNPNIQIPKQLKLAGPKKEIYGYGFFNAFYPLDDIYATMPPVYSPYDSYTEKLGTKQYDLMKRSSFIRFENKDFTDFKKDSRHIFFADRNFLYLDGAADFLKECNKHYFHFNYVLEVKDEETFLKFFPFNFFFSGRRMFINFRFSEDFFKKYYNEKILFDWSMPRDDENDTVAARRFATMLLYYKVNKIIPCIKISPNNEGLLLDIIEWGRSGSQSSFYKYYEDNKKVLNRADRAASDLRLLLKTDPKKLQSSDIDFKGIL
jgi:hypothetical protein